LLLYKQSSNGIGPTFQNIMWTAHDSRETFPFIAQTKV